MIAHPPKVGVVGANPLRSTLLSALQHSRKEVSAFIGRWCVSLGGFCVADVLRTLRPLWYRLRRLPSVSPRMITMAQEKEEENLGPFWPPTQIRPRAPREEDSSSCTRGIFPTLISSAVPLLTIARRVGFPFPEALPPPHRIKAQWPTQSGFSINRTLAANTSEFWRNRADWIGRTQGRSRKNAWRFAIYWEPSHAAKEKKNLILF